MFTPITDDHINRLTTIVGANNLSTAQADRDQHSRDQSGHQAHSGEAVVWPTDARQVADVLKFANEHAIAVTPWGAGTSLEGNPIPLHGGILLSCARLNRIEEVHAADFQVTVQPGVGYKDLNEHLSRHGLFFAPDPGANASIGGMLANNAAGIRTIKYGASKDNVIRLQVALADGRLIDMGSRSIKQSSGYDLLHLVVGSEGTLGVITEATLRLAPVAERMSAVVAGFETVDQAIDAVITIRGSGLDLAALEFIDGPTAQLLDREEGVKLGSLHTLFMEFHAAHQQTLELSLETVRLICVDMGAVNVQTTADTAERKQLWHARHHAYEMLVRSFPDCRFMVLDVAVPISAYSELVLHIMAAFESLEVTGFLIGHAGDGNMHVVLPYPDEATYLKGTTFNDSVVRKALDLGGTAAGEHGVGIGKRAYMRDEHGPALDVMLALKHTLDPKGILNPGKIF